MATMQYGKFRGWEMKDIPRSYLIWLCKEKEDDLTKFQKECGLEPWWSMSMKARDEKIKRLEQEIVRLKDELSGVEIGREVRAEVLDRWYREATLRYHPDRGGQTEIMKAVNDIHDRLKLLLAA
jgi:hypothetical protein